MIKKIFSEYKNFVSNLGKMLLLLLSCAVVGCAIVFPLWKFATISPKAYTTAVLIVFCGIFAVAFVKKVKSVGAKILLLKFAKIAFLLGSISACFALVLSGLRTLAIIEIVVAIAIYAVISSILSKSKQN